MTSRRAVLLVTLLAACSGDAGPGAPGGECEASCADVVATCPGETSEAACLATCGSVDDFVWAAAGPSGDECRAFFMGDRAEVPCGLFPLLPCGAGAPDAGAGAPDARPPTGTPDAGAPTGVEPCPIEKEDLDVDFPYVSLSPATVVELFGYCYRQHNGSISEGHDHAEAHDELRDATGTVAVTDVGGVLKQIRFLVEQVPVSPGGLDRLASATGIPRARLSAAQNGTLVNVFGSARVVGYTLPAGVGLDAFLASSHQEKGFVTFTSQSSTAIEKVLADLSSGISITVEVQRAFGFSGDRYEYRLRLSRSGTKVTVESIRIL
jgi:hypothetical protein